MCRRQSVIVSVVYPWCRVNLQRSQQILSVSMHYLYLHGFASSPRSKKAQTLGKRFAQVGTPLQIPDLNQDNFTHLTLTRQIQQIGALLPPQAAPVTLIGSSLGGLVATWVAERHPQVQRLVLLAPAFGFLDHWLPRLGEAQVQHWRREGQMAIYHYGEEKPLPLDYGFIEDARQYREQELQRPLPTLILHGNADEVIPLQASIEFSRDRPWVQLIPLASDHALENVSDQIWQEICQFCELG